MLPYDQGMTLCEVVLGPFLALGITLVFIAMDILDHEYLPA